MISTPETLHAGTPAHLALLATGSAADLAAALDAARGEPAHGGVDHLIRIRHARSVDAGDARHRAAVLTGRTGAVPLGPSAALVSAAQPVAFLLPGLGDHYLGMGRELHRSLPVFREHLDHCTALLQPELGTDLRDVIFAGQATATGEVRPSGGLDLRRMLGRGRPAPSAEESRLHETRYAQPALFAVEYALARQWQAWGLQPEVMIGYSLGEYVAACLAGVLSLEDSLALVARRALLIEELPPGAMLAVMLPEAEVASLLGAHLSISAVNGPEFCVLSGPPEEIERVETQLSGRGAAIRRVQSSHAFHSRMMEPIADRVAQLVGGMTRTAPRIPYVSNVTGTFITAAQATDPAYWAAHLVRPVRFADGLRAVRSPVLLEVGPGQTLSSLASTLLSGPRAPAARTQPCIVASMRHAYDPDPDVAVLLRAMASLWIQGAAVDWDRFPRAPLAVPAPGGDGVHGADSSAASRAAPAMPSSKTEQELAGLWQTLLQCEPPALDAHFFRLGGNSLVATRLIDRVSRTFRVKLPLRRVYEAPTLGAMAAAIEALRGGGAAAVASAPAPQRSREATAAPRSPLFRLPNGLLVAHQNEAETLHFYDDIFAHRSYVKHGIRIPDGGCVLDVGGNIGLFTLFAHTEAVGVRLFTFEPAPPLFEILKRNVAQHAIRATLFPIGLSNTERTAPFTFYPHSAGMSSFHPDEAEERHNLKTIIENQRRTGDTKVDHIGEHAEELLDVRFAATTFTARLRRLSDVLREQTIERVDLMKVDVQKCELEVIEGIDEADWPRFSQIVLEAHDIDGRVGQLESLFERQGFAVEVEQDELYVGTNIYNIYAIRKGQ